MFGQNQEKIVIKQTSIWLGIGLVSTVSWLHAAELKDIVKDNLCSSIISDRFTSATRSSNCHPGLKTLSIDLTASQTPSTFSLPDGSELNVANTLTLMARLFQKSGVLRQGIPLI